MHIQCLLRQADTLRPSEVIQFSTDDRNLLSWRLLLFVFLEAFEISFIQSNGLTGVMGVKLVWIFDLR